MMKPTNSLLALLAAVPSSHLTAATYNWTGTTSGAWTTTIPANWNGTSPTFDNTADVIFGDTPAIVTPITFLGDGPRTVRSISVTGAPLSPLEIRTNQNNATGRILHFSSSTGTANLNIASTVTQTLNIGQGTGTNNVGNVNLVSDLAIDHQGSALLTISRPINETVAGRSISKSGTGTLLLNQANTYTGSTIITGGILRLGNANGLGATSGDTFVQSGATLDLNGQLVPAGETINITGAGHNGMGALYSSTGNSGTANFITDNLVLSGNSTIGVPSGVRVGIGGNGTSTTSGLFTLTKVGAGQFDLRGIVTIGDVVINQGALQIEAGTIYNNNGYTVTVNSGAYFRAYELVNPFTRNLVLNGGNIATAGTLPTGNQYTGNVTLTGSNGIESGGGDGDLMIFSGNFTETAPGASLTTTGARRTVLSGTNTYTGPTNVNSGIFQASGSFTSNFNVSATATLDGEGSTTGTITLANGTAIQFDPSTTGTDQFLRAADFIIPADATIPVFAKVAAPGSNIVVLRDANGGLDLNRFQLQTPGRASLSLGGAGGNSDLIYNFPAATLEWRAFQNTDWGTEDWENFQNLGTAQPDVFFARDNVDFTDAATGEIYILSPVSPGNVTFKNTTGKDIHFLSLGGGSIDATSIATTPATTGNVTFELPVTGTSPITLDGTGTVTLAAANTSTGTITINAGTFQLGNGTNLATLAAPIVNNSAVVIDRTDTLTLGQAISGTGTLTQNSAGTLILGGDSTYTGLTRVNAGILQIGNAATGSIAGNLETNAVVDFNRTAALTYPGTISGTGSVNKRGTNTLTLTGTSTFTGGISLYNGILIATGPNLGTGPVTMGPGLTNTNTLAIAGGTIANDIFFSNGGTGLKIINLAAGFTDATLAGTIHLDSSTLTGSGANRISPALGGTIVISGKMTGDGAAGYSKRAPGHVVITNTTNDYTGPTSIVDSGHLIVDGRVPGNVFFGEVVGVGGTGNVLGTLAGSGSIGGSVKLELNSSLSPGGTSVAGTTTDTRATLTIDGGLDASLIPNGSGRLRFQLGAPDGISDRVNLGGTLNLGTDSLGLTEFFIANGGGLAAGTYTLIHAAGGITGTLDPFDISAPILPGFAGELAIVGNDVVLTVTGSGNPYEGWAASFPLLTDTSFDLDFDGDGISTGLEWILGGDPTLSDAATIAPQVTANATDGITLTFHRNEDSIPFATLSVEYGTTLTTFPASAVVGATTSGPDSNGVTITVNDAPTPDNITVTIPATNASNGKLFARLRATNP